MFLRGLVCASLCVFASAVNSIRSGCYWGGEPGYWLRHEWGQLAAGQGDLPLSDPANGVPFGAAWKPMSDKCQTRNFFEKYMSKTRERTRTIVFIGESLDMQLLGFTCQYYDTQFGKTSRQFHNSFKAINYCTLPSGLTLLHIMLLRVSHEEDKEVVQAVNHFFGGNDEYSMKDVNDDAVRTKRQSDVEYITAMTRRPDIVVIASTSFPLQKRFSSFQYSNTFHLEEEFLLEYEDLMRDIVQAVRNTFMGTRVMIRTSPEAQTHCEHGHGFGNTKAWVHRSYVAQLNAAARHIADDESIDLIDLEAMGMSFTPHQLTHDGVHPKSFFAFEYLNILLNYS